MRHANTLTTLAYHTHKQTSDDLSCKHWRAAWPGRAAGVTLNFLPRPDKNTEPRHALLANYILYHYPWAPYYVHPRTWRPYHWYQTVLYHGTSYFASYRKVMLTLLPLSCSSADLLYEGGFKAAYYSSANYYDTMILWYYGMIIIILWHYSMI